MAVRKAMIEDQLAAVANAMRTINSPSRDLDDFSLKILMVSWANFSRRSRDEKARERAWRAACSERLKSKSVVQWRIWARCGRMAMMAELASREGMAEARRCVYVALSFTLVSSTAVEQIALFCSTPKYLDEIAGRDVRSGGWASFDSHVLPCTLRFCTIL